MRSQEDLFANTLPTNITVLLPLAYVVVIMIFVKDVIFISAWGVISLLLHSTFYFFALNVKLILMLNFSGSAHTF